MATPSTAHLSRTPAERFRAAIEAANAAGVDLSQHVLQLTFSDSAKLRRDRSIPQDDIRFSDGQMLFIGVRVVEGAPVSELADMHGVIAASDSSTPAEKTMAKGQKKTNKEIRKPKAASPSKGAPAGHTFTSPGSKPPR